MRIFIQRETLEIFMRKWPNISALPHFLISVKHPAKSVGFNIFNFILLHII